MPKTKRASPRPGRTGNGPPLEEIEDALAVEILDQENLKMLREVRKRHRTTAEGKGVNLGQLDDLYRRRDDAAEEIMDYFRGLFRTFSAHFEAFTEMDFFVKKTTTSEKAGFEHVGRMAGLKGEPGAAPQNLVGEEQQDWLKGYARGSASRQKNAKSLSETLMEALKTAAEGGVVDGTGKGLKMGAPMTKAEKAAAKAAADAANPPSPDAPKAAPGEVTPGQPDWTGFDADPMKWEPEQSRAFRAWYDKIPAGETVRTDHPGVTAAMRAAAADTFEASTDEIAAQAGRKGGATDAEDPLVVGGVRFPNATQANAARRLAEINAANKPLSQSEKAAKKRAEAGAK